MKKSNIKQQIISFIKNHPIKILVSGTGGVSFFWGMNKIIDLNHTNILQMLSNIRNILLNVNTDKSEHTARPRSAWIPVNRAQRHFVFHISKFVSMTWPLAA